MSTEIVHLKNMAKRLRISASKLRRVHFVEMREAGVILSRVRGRPPHKEWYTYEHLLLQYEVWLGQQGRSL